MYRRDYLMRLIEQTTEVLHKVMFARNNHRLQEALELLNQAMRQLLGLNSKLVHALSTKDLLALLSKDGDIDQGKVLALGDMLNAQAAAHEESGHTAEARKAGLKVLEILLFAREMDSRGELAELFQARIDTSLQVIGRAPMSMDTLHKLVFYYDDHGQYGKSEDVLFHLLEELQEEEQRTEELAAVLDEGIRMYERWLSVEVEQLNAGNLTKIEVEEGLDELKNIKIKYVNIR
ncbi:MULTISPECIES: DUF6483 family protein [unclassified Paenibacillus]|uniref:DUF6483 family protein n=1 Tax=unclassified Paenibacillus TaxID=185978 RepID=UPI001AE4777E|nr:MULTISPECIES: DUF6483 family protein [unclassified Paenibacillus]MBP1153857.1 tetratricopeptide (TPR) repeat protein [Paenibacillus sp. PvP091]MBP1170758.1 tetratricopeptide (TPR) repeat protein [Paenibacillus sp. PvR098]MBP2441786.1 tetratricopeptide (TPR) repeat protein [Paenibacillus sp. PvP052]